MLRVVADPPKANTARILTFMGEASASGAGLALFPVTATTGTVNDDIPRA
ncbi:MAG TPA: hypothetical protein VLH79_00300 [Chthonomonadales bacterium]|nr:hypothetical protein [Chthonomonadales bacterium]